VAALHVEAIRNALKAKPDGKITGVDVKAGFEKISNFTLGGLVPPLKITSADHEGGGLVQIWQVKGGKFEKVTDWYAAYTGVGAKHIKAAVSEKPGARVLRYARKEHTHATVQHWCVGCPHRADRGGRRRL